MTSPKRIERKLFLTFSLTSTAALLLGCGGDASTPSPGAGGSGGSGGSGAGAGGAHAAGASGAATAGSGGSNAGSSGSAGASGGAAGSAGSGGAAGGGMAGSPAVTPNCSTQLKTFIGANHGHVLNVTAADVQAGVDKVYDTKGASTHTHFIKLTAADFTKLASGGTVRKLSCNDGHEHEYIVNCVGIAEPTKNTGIGNFCQADPGCADTNVHVCAMSLPEPT
jgi:hypothetical protein